MIKGFSTSIICIRTAILSVIDGGDLNSRVAARITNARAITELYESLIHLHVCGTAEVGVVGSS